mmetsp:Transcript_31588/g.88583  ORF Transcript_31588/g.88583 Transcript_31588/m.88583 type:complete len:135 (-) Transcript_31588:27-431(-)
MQPGDSRELRVGVMNHGGRGTNSAGTPPARFRLRVRTQDFLSDAKANTKDHVRVALSQAEVGPLASEDQAFVTLTVTVDDRAPTSAGTPREVEVEVQATNLEDGFTSAFAHFSVILMPANMAELGKSLVPRWGE